MRNFTRFSHWTYKKTKSFILRYPCGLVGTDFTSPHLKASNHQNITSFYEQWFGLFLKDTDITRNSTINSILSLFLNYLYFAGMVKFMPHLDYNIMNITSVQFIRSVVSDSLRPLNHSTPGLPAHHQLREFTQTHVHRVGDAIQSSHPLSPPSLPAPNPSQHQGLFQWLNSSHQVAKVLEFQPQHQSFQWTHKTDLF